MSANGENILPESAFAELVNLLRDQQQTILQLSSRVDELNRTVTERNLDHFLTVKEVAKFLGVTERHVRDLCDNHILSCHRFGKIIRIQVRDLNAFNERYHSQASSQTTYHTRPTATSRSRAKQSRQNRSAA